MIATLDSVKKAFLVGLGATVVTAEKLKDLVDDLVEKGELKQQDAKGFADDLKARALQERESFEQKLREHVDGAVKKALDNMGLATKKDLDTLREDLLAQLNTHNH
jgi:polyhydroxyalkanoate synthesis regulator phasin